MDVIAIRQFGEQIGLDLTDAYKRAHKDRLERVANGVGPSWFPTKLRELSTEIFQYFLPSTNQHDFDYDDLEKTKKNFKIANKRLYKNCKIQIRKDKNLTYFTFKRKKSKWIKKGEAKFLYRMCVDFGEKAFFDE